MLTANTPEWTASGSAAAVGIPEPVVDRLMSALATALRTLRADFPDRSEQVVAAEWRGGFRDRAGFLDDPHCYFLIAHAATVCLDTLVRTPAEHRAPKLELITRNWWLAVLDPRSKEPDDFGDVIMASLDRHGIPRPPQGAALDVGGPRAAVLGVVESVGAMHRHLGGGPIDDRTMGALHALCLAGQAVNAPEAVWEGLAARAPAPGPNGSAPVETPDALTNAIVGTELRLRATMAATAERYNQLSRADSGVRNDLDNRELSANTESMLTGAGVNVSNIQTLLARRREFDRAGILKKLAMGSGRTLLVQECARVKHHWTQRVDAARAAAAHARATRDYEIDGYTAQVAAFAPGPESKLGDWLRPQSGYAGADLAARGITEWVPHTLWHSVPLPDRPWSLPRLVATHPNVLLFSDEHTLSYAQACAVARDVVLDKLSRTAPGRLLLTWVDPVGRGQSAGSFLELLEIDKTLIDEKVWSEPDEIATALRRVSDRMATLEQQCLKDTYADIESYNQKAGSLAEAYQVVVVTGFPRGFTEDSAQRLKQITEQGARLGISVVTVLDPAVREGLRATLNPAHGYPTFTVYFGQDRGMPPWWGTATFPEGMWVAGHDGRPVAPIAADGTKDIVWAPCAFLGYEPGVAKAIVEGYALASKDAADVLIDSDDLVTEDGDGPPETTRVAIDVPLGVRGRGNKVELRLGKDLSQNVLIGGMPGSGKSVLMHTLITTAARRYSPRELEMYLLDFKQGVEFQPYAKEALPHARVVAVQSEREFGLSVLRGLKREIDTRSALFREVGADRLEEYRDYVAKVRPLDAEEVLPRVLVVVDEFQVMFADDDAIAHECARLLDHVVRQGRAFGIHLVLGTQTLRGQGTMSLLRGTLDQVAVRIVLKTGESDSRLFLGDDNPAASRLSRRGEAIFNPDGGRPEGNMAFQVAFTSDESRDGVARRARRRADESGFTRRPLVFDGTRKIDVTEDEQVAAWLDGRATPDSRIIRAHVGLPVAIGGSGAVELSRRAGRNLAIVHRDGAITSGSALVAVVTAMRSSAATPRISIIECLGSDEEHAEDLARLGAWRGAVTWGRWRKVLAGTLAEAAAEVRRRVDADDYGAQPWLLVINALQRARVLDAEPSFDETGSPQQDLMSVLADGSDVGVHVIVTADSVEAVDRRLGPGALDQFGARLIGQCSEDASQRLLGSIAASRLGPAYALLDEPEDSRRETLRPFPMPAPDWVAAATRD